jgi:SPX domain protein involved in polyphosphate accumulation
LIKKHAKWCRLSPNTPYSLSSRFVPHLETQRPFHRRVDFQKIVRQLSFLYNARLDPDQQSTEQTQTALDLADRNMYHSMQSSVTYWVHNDNQVETELFLLKHLTLQLPSSPLSSRDIQRSARTAYLDTGDWSVYTSLVPESPNQFLQFKVPQILWEENSRNKDVVIVIPEEEEYLYLPLKRKSVANFLSSKEEELDLESLEWIGPSIEQWTETARKVHKYIHQSSLHPSISFFNDSDCSNSNFCRPNEFCKTFSQYLRHESCLRYNGQKRLFHSSTLSNRLSQTRWGRRRSR